MTTQYITRAFDGNRWVARIPVDSLETAVTQAREFMDIIGPFNEPAWLLIEVAATDAYAVIERQWVDNGRGYKAVVGRSGQGSKST